DLPRARPLFRWRLDLRRGGRLGGSIPALLFQILRSSGGMIVVILQSSGQAAVLSGVFADANKLGSVADPHDDSAVVRTVVSLDHLDVEGACCCGRLCHGGEFKSQKRSIT